MARSTTTRRSDLLANFVAALLVALSLLPAASARRWDDVIDVAIYAQSHVDIPRIQFAIEDNPLNVAPTVILLTESQPPSDAPSQVPSYYNQDEGDNEPNPQSVKLDCPYGEDAYKVNKYDTWGDGWGETTLSIRQVGRLEGAPQANVAISQDVSLGGFGLSSANTQKRTYNARNSWSHRELEDYVLIGGLKSGDFDSQHVCLSRVACYEVALQGGKWQEEAKWEIVPVNVDEGTSAASRAAVAKGRGFSNCTFYVAEGLGSQLDCPFTCRPSPEPEEEEIEEMAEEEVDQALGEMQAIAVEEVQEDEDATRTGSGFSAEAEDVTQSPNATALMMEPSSAPSDFPSLVPTRTL